MKLFKGGKHRGYFILVFTCLLLSIDQISKYVASLIFKQKIFLGFRSFGFKYVTYTTFHIYGIIKIKDPHMLIHIIVIVVGILFFYLFYRFLILYSTSRKLIYWAFIFSFAGLLSNLVDNILLGYARDFLVFWKEGIFNFADIFYYVGLALFLFCLFADEKIRRKMNRTSGEDIKAFSRFLKSEIKRLIITPFKVFVKIKALFRNM